MTRTSPAAGPGAPDARRWLAAARVDAEVLALCPGYAALLVTADGLVPGPSDAASDALLAAALVRAASRLDGRPPEEHEHIRQWREAYRAFGARPQRTRPSVEALLRRLETGIPRVDRITDAYNAISIAHLLPAGGEDRSAYIGAARLTRATGTEDFDTARNGLPFSEHPEQGEVVWRDDKGVTCRRWNWRQCPRTRITEGTTTAVFVLDGLPALGIDGLRAAAADLRAALAAQSPDATFASRLITGAGGPGPADPGAEF
jgi:DNA/RNA-binding domain of Phe-tRNA-synthetase-like protein